METGLRHVRAAVGGFAAHPDPLAASGNFIALLVVSNQPFYPLYVYWLVSGKIAATFLTFLSTPFFLMVPILARKHSLLGRALLPLAGIGNSILCAKIFGVASAVEMFLIPCAVLGVLLFRPQERLASYAIVGLAFGAFIGLHGGYGAPFHDYSPAEYAAFARLNIISAAALTVCIALVFSNLLARSERAGDGPG
jgi:hypothetical protein